MQFLKREIPLFLASTALAAACMLAWGSPFLAAAESSAARNQSASISASPLVTLTGTIVQENGQYLLRDDSDKDYRLDDAVRAKPLSGKSVRITGLFEEKTNLVHIDSIAQVAA
jgi:hypothetical protein